MLEIKHLITLQTLKETQSLIEASKVLNLTLSALSHQIKGLENHYQCTLFVRKSKPIQFTRQGMILLDLAQNVLPLVDEADYQLNNPEDTPSGQFNMALECHSCYQWLIPTIHHFRTTWPLVETDLVVGFNFEPFPELIANELDIVITADPINNNNLEFIPLFDFEMKLGVSKKHELSKKPYLVPEDLSNETLISYPVSLDRLTVLTHFMNPENIAPKKIRYAELTLMMVELTAIGQGICCLPNWVFSEYQQSDTIAILPMGKNGLMQTLYVACRKEDRDSKLVQEFIKLAKINCVKHLKKIDLH